MSAEEHDRSKQFVLAEMPKMMAELDAIIKDTTAAEEKAAAHLARERARLSTLKEEA